MIESTVDLAEWTRIEAGIPETRQSPFVSRGSVVFGVEQVCRKRTYEGRSHCRVRPLADRISKNRNATAVLCRRERPSCQRNSFPRGSFASSLASHVKSFSCNIAGDYNENRKERDDEVRANSSYDRAPLPWLTRVRFTVTFGNDRSRNARVMPA